MTSTKANPPATVARLTADPQNRRGHPARNLDLIAQALREVGAARSIVIDENDVVLAGNGVVQAAPRAGLTKLRVVEADGDEVIAVRRRGLTAAQKRALALYDNRTAELAEWDVAQLLADQAEGLDLTSFWSDAELATLLGGKAPSDPEAARRTLAERFGVPPFSVLDARQGYWQERKRAWLALGIESELGRGGGTWRESATGSPLDRQRAYSEG